MNSEHEKAPPLEVTPEIDVTPEMVDAGVSVLVACSIADRTVCCVTPRRLLASFTLMNPLGREVTAFPPLSASALSLWDASKGSWCPGSRSWLETSTS